MDLSVAEKSYGLIPESLTLRWYRRVITSRYKDPNNNVTKVLKVAHNHLVDRRETRLCWPGNVSRGQERVQLQMQQHADILFSA